MCSGSLHLPLLIQKISVQELNRALELHGNYMNYIPAITFSKLTIEKLEQGVKYV